MRQPIYPTGSHDSIQYHFFCEHMLFAVRIFRTDSLEHHSAWLFDGEVRTVVSSQAKLTQSGDDHLNVSAETLRMSGNVSGGYIAANGPSADDTFEIAFTLGQTFRWSDTLEEVIHQPNLRCSVTFRGRNIQGQGYCKRYSWAKPPRYWGYRFLQGFTDDGQTSIWTADAVFGTNKYDYFKILHADGTLIGAAENTSAHKQDFMFGDIEDTRHVVKFQELGVWDQILKSSSMDSHLRQRYGRVEYFDGKTCRTGVALTEYCFGTLG